jgi:riboflavin kinase/FMN adenylyltransferase
MNLYRSLQELPSIQEPVDLAIGIFDGIHFGHHALLSKLKSNSKHTAVFTFSNHPRQVLKKEPAPPLLSDSFLKWSLLEVHGVDTLIEIPFTPELAALSYDTFLNQLLAKLPLSRLLLGVGEAFGKNREGIPEKLLPFAQEKGFTIDYFPKLILEGEPVSSSRIRALIQAGDLSTAERLLGRPYILSIPAQKRRIDGSHLCLPPTGTYNFFTEEGKPLPIQIEKNWIQLPKAFPSPTVIASKIIEEFYV